MASSVGEAQQSVYSQKRKANEREEELCWGKRCAAKKVWHWNGNVYGRRLYFDEESLAYLSGDTGREQGVVVTSSVKEFYSIA